MPYAACAHLAHARSHISLRLPARHHKASSLYQYKDCCHQPVGLAIFERLHKIHQQTGTPAEERLAQEKYYSSVFAAWWGRRYDGPGGLNTST